ncbi:MAG TPA: RnfH family protein [Gammaproteobacteria bacterium]|nr:RnfH family protein [Gammaproteobacteria bacterium]
MVTSSNRIVIEIAYAKLDQQRILVIHVDEACTVEQAILQSGILSLFPEIDLNKQRVGIFGKQIRLDSIVHEGNRIEIYRPLKMDPKELRRIKSKLPPF